MYESRARKFLHIININEEEQWPEDEALGIPFVIFFESGSDLQYLE